MIELFDDLSVKRKKEIEEKISDIFLNINNKMAFIENILELDELFTNPQEKKFIDFLIRLKFEELRDEKNNFN